MKNIRIVVANPQKLEETEAQIYANYKRLTVEEIAKGFGKECVLAPEIGNFPHMGGHNKPVQIVGIFATHSEDNAGLDISSVIRKYQDWGVGTMKAIEFNIQYDGHVVHLKVNKGEFKGDSYRTSSTRNQAWTDQHGDTLVTVTGLVRSLKLKNCEVVKAVKLPDLWS